MSNLYPHDLRNAAIAACTARDLLRRESIYAGDAPDRDWARERQSEAAGLADLLVNAAVADLPGSALPLGPRTTMQRGFTEAALWADCQPPESAGEDAESGGEEAMGLEPDAAMTERYAEVVGRFMVENLDDLLTYIEHVDTSSDGDDPWAYAGHDLWLTLRGHGAGFWDRFPAPIPEALTMGPAAAGMDVPTVNAERTPLYELGQRLTEACKRLDLGDGDGLMPFDLGDGTAGL